jgi:hypothetical protein
VVSTVNYGSPTTDVANFAIVPLPADGSGKLTIYSDSTVIDAALDVTGYLLP